MTKQLLIVLAVSLSLTACSSANETTNASQPPQVCLTDAPGGKLCGSDAKSFCQNMKEGQTVDPQSVGATTRRQCAALGVHGLR